ncbi:MAG: hypothetical protein H7X95_12515 [Deltaproteobacteria bacterium]|nr:hypothetical protein [Deltaproteobacteria bacterium]
MVWALVCLAGGCDDDLRSTETLLTGVAPAFLSVDDVFLYWSELDGGRSGPIKHVPKDNVHPATVKILGDGYAPVAVQGFVYATTTDDATLSLHRYAASQARLTVGSFQGFGSRLATDGENVYFSTFAFPTAVSQIWVQPGDGSRARLLVADAHGQAGNLVAGGGEVYWTGDATRSTVPYGEKVGGVIRKVSSSGGAAVTVFESPFRLGALALDQQNLFFVTDEAEAVTLANGVFASQFRRKIMKLVRQSGAIVPLVTTGHPSGLATDGAHVYWSDAAQGTVQRIPVGGGAVLTVAAVNDPRFVALDADYVYFTTANSSTGSILRQPKPRAERP